MPTTPQAWLVFIHTLLTPQPSLFNATMRRLAHLSIIESHAALTLLYLRDSGTRTPDTATITRTGGRSISQKIMRSMETKKIITSVCLPHTKRHFWRLDTSAIPTVRSIHNDLAALIVKINSKLPATQP